jgi:hypothetical protein
MIKSVIIFLILILLTNCNSLREGLSFKKEDSVDEFLIKKKNPLVMPPNFDEIPKPVSEEILQNEDDSKLDLDLLLGDNDSVTKQNQKNDGELEKSISTILNQK